MYAKAHPFGYKPVKKHVEDYGRGCQPSRKQVINQKDGSVKTISHFDRVHKGRTLADMVYESYPM